MSSSSDARVLQLTDPRDPWTSSQQELWPEYFELQVIRRRGALRELHGWLARHPGQFPRCMLMPDRLPEHAASRRNHALFEDFARRLLEEEIVSVPSCAASVLPRDRRTDYLRSAPNCRSRSAPGAIPRRSSTGGSCSILRPRPARFSSASSS